MNLIYHSEKYKNWFSEILYYSTSQSYRESKELFEVEHSNYRIEGNSFRHINTNYKEYRYYAFGILVPILSTRILPIDIDMIPIDRIQELTLKINTIPEIEQLDLLISSTGGSISQRNYHIILGFTKDINGHELLRSLNTSICKGYMRCATENKALVLRTSQKFWADGNITSPPRHIVSYLVNSNKKTKEIANITLPKKEDIESKNDKVSFFHLGNPYHIIEG
jgi:hypothetical protein